MRSVKDSRALWDATLQPGIRTLHELKQVLETGTEGPNPCEDGLRSVCWKAILLHRDIDQSNWSIQLSDSREAYTSVKQHFLRYIDNPDELSSTVDPLTEDAESPWEALRKDELIRAEISQDVERCLQENSFFHDPMVKLRLLDILFVFVKLNPDLGYRQGMHELLAPILWIVSQDAVNLTTVNEGETSAAHDKEALLLKTLDPTYIENDSFILFCSIMQTAKEFYEHNDGKSKGGVSDVSSIITRSQNIHQVILRQVDPELADHLVTIEILPQIFLTRWIRLLFGREFPFDDVLAIWDLLVAENVRSSLIDLICVSMLLRIRWQLLEADYSTALALLLRYPTPESTKPRTFVLDALYLEQNTTAEGASYLVEKYSGKPISQKVVSSEVVPHAEVASPTTRRKSSSISRDIFTTPSNSPSRPNSKRLDSIFQDVSEGLYRRAEGWGVTKAVRGAVVEARRNMQGLQAAASREATFNNDGPSWDSPSPPRISLATVRDLSSKISALERRNKALATILEDVLNALHEEKDAKVKDELTTKIATVKDCLQDSSIPLDLVAKPIEKERHPIVGSSDDASTIKMTALSHALDSTSSKRPQSLDDGEERPGALGQLPGVANTTATRPARSTRTSVRDSSFSWILGDDQARPSFATSASVPPEQRREPPRSLFTGIGDDDDDQTSGQAGVEGLVLADLQHAPRSMRRHRSPDS